MAVDFGSVGDDMKLIKTTMSFIVAMTALLIVAVQLGTFDKLMAWRAQPQTTNLNVNVDVNGGQTQPGVLVLMRRPVM